VRAIPGDMAAKLRLAAPLFVERGLDATTMSDIAAASGVPRATLYYHFEGKDAVFACIIESVSRALETAIRAALETPGTAAERLGRVVVAQLSVYESDPAAFLATHLELGRTLRLEGMKERVDRGYIQPVARLLEEGMADGTIRPVGHPSAVAAALLAAVGGAASVLLPVDGQRVADIHDAMMLLMIHGLPSKEPAQS
jgi:TetR/AcrR family transcriptional regulator